MRGDLRSRHCLTRQRNLLEQSGSQLVQSVIDGGLELGKGGSGTGDAPLAHASEDLLAFALQLGKQPVGLYGAGLLE